MSSFKGAVEELLQDPGLREAYDRQAAIIHIAQLIRAWRKSAGLTQTELAKRIHTKQTVISRLESSENDKMPNIETLAEIAHACNMRLVLGSGDANIHDERLIAL